MSDMIESDRRLVAQRFFRVFGRLPLTALQDLLEGAVSVRQLQRLRQGQAPSGALAARMQGLLDRPPDMLPEEHLLDIAERYREVMSDYQRRVPITFVRDGAGLRFPRYYDRALEALEAGRFEVAEAALAAHLEEPELRALIPPVQLPYMIQTMGLICHYQGRYHRAWELFAEAEQLAAGDPPASVPLRAALASMQASAGARSARFDEALEAGGRAIELEPGRFNHAANTLVAAFASARDDFIGYWVGRIEEIVKEHYDEAELVKLLAFLRQDHDMAHVSNHDMHALLISRLEAILNAMRRQMNRPGGESGSATQRP